MSRVHRAFDVLFEVRPSEFARVQAFFVYFATIGMFYTVGTTVGDTLFLSRLGPDVSGRLLPWLFLGITVATVAVSSAYGWAERRLPRVPLLLGTPMVLAVSLVAFRQLVRGGALATFFALAVWLEVCALVSITLFFSLAGDYFTSRDARRLYGYITGGLALGNFVSGQACAPLARDFGTEALIYVCAGLLVAGALCVVWVTRVAKRVGGDGEASAGQAVSMRAVVANGYIRVIYALVAASVVVSVLLNYQFKITAVQELQGAELAAFFGKLYGYSGLAQLVVQFALVGWLLRRFGIVTSLHILPLLMTVGSASCFLWPMVIVPALTNGVRISLTETLDLPARELLFLPLAARLRTRTQAVLGGVLVPVARGVGGVMLLLLLPAFPTVRWFALVALVAAATWLVCARALRSRYMRTLSRSLRDRALRPVDVDALLKGPDAANVLTELLRVDWPDAPAQLLRLAERDPDAVSAPRIAELARHDEEPVAVAALGLLGTLGERSPKGVAEDALDDPRPHVRWAAALALGQIALDDAVAPLARRFDDSAAEVRAAALAACARWGGVEGGLVAYARLSRLLESERAHDRAEAALALADIGGRGFARVLGRLMADPDGAVQKAAVVAAVRLRDPALCPTLMAGLATPGLRASCVAALSAMPPSAADALAARARDAARPRVERLALVRALGAIESPRAAEGLFAVVEAAEDIVLACAAARSLRRLRERSVPIPVPRDALVRARTRVSDGLALALAARGECRAGSFTRELFGDHAWVSVALLASLFATDHSPRKVRAMETALLSGTEAERANALELAEATLSREEADRVVPLLGTVVAGGGASEGDGTLRAPTIERLLSSEHWLRAVVFWDHERRGLEPPKGAKMDPRDRKLVDLLPTIAVLKQTDFFKDMRANDLASLAEAAEERIFEPGAKILTEGKVPDAFYIVCEGKVRVVMEGRELWQFGAPNCVGDVTLLDGGPETLTCEVIERVRALAVVAEDFESLVMTEPVLARAILKKMAHRCIDLVKAAYAKT